MYLDAAKKQEIFSKYGKSNTDTGSAEAQIALFSYRITHLTEHMKLNRKDYSTERALTMLVGKRRALLRTKFKSRFLHREETAFIFYLSPLLGYKISLILQQNELNYNLLPGKYIQTLWIQVKS